MLKLSAKNRDKQKTLNQSVILSGVGVHAGLKSTIKINPAPPDFGIKFIFKGKIILADIKNITSDKLETSLGNIHQVEHFLSASAGLGLSNLSVELSSEELPIMDGSALPFVEAFEAAGIFEQDKPRKIITLEKPLRVEESDKFILAEPEDSFSVDFMVDYKVIGRQTFFFDGSLESFKKEIAPARTFGYKEDVEKLNEAGLAKGASLENSLGISEKGYLNKPRFENEPVRHKILDLIGDLALLGFPLKAKIKAFKSSHKMNHELVRQILRIPTKSA